MIVKVATFRNAVDHLFRVVNVDYHACVGAAELRNWQGIAGRVRGSAGIHVKNSKKQLNYLFRLRES